MVDRSLETAAQMSRFAIASAAFRIRHAMRFGDEKQTGVVDSIGSCSRAEVTSACQKMDICLNPKNKWRFKIAKNFDVR